MKVVSLSVVAFSLIGCSSPEARTRDAETRARDALMDSIENSIRLPTGAKPLDTYARYYAPASGEDVVGVFILPGLDDLPPGEGCEELLPNMTTAPCYYAWPKSTDVGAGNRVWLSDYSMLPMPMRDADNCSFVTMVYRTTEKHFLEVSCFEDSVDY